MEENCHSSSQQAKMAANTCEDQSYVFRSLILNLNIDRGRMNIAHNMFILPRDPIFVLPQLGSIKLLQDNSITPCTIVKMLLKGEIEVKGSPVK